MTSVGNAGFLIRSGDAAILVDALYRDGVQGYDPVPPERREALESARAPFDGVSLLLATHVHADHFDPEAAGRHLVANPAARLVTTRQAAEAMAAAFAGYAQVKDRVTGITPAEGAIAELPGDATSGIRVRVMNLPHGVTENIGFLVEIGGMRLLHVGDTDAGASLYDRLALRDEAIDVALLPYWLVVYEPWRGTVAETIGARRLVIMHLPLAGGPAEDVPATGGRDAMLAGIRARHPGAVVLPEPMTSATIAAAP